MSDIKATISGLPDYKAALLGVPAQLRKRALRNALAAGARLLRDEARRATPVLAVAVRNAAGQITRKPGTVRNALAVRTSKASRSAGNVGVFVNVRPAQGAKFKTQTTSKMGGLIKTRSRVQTRASKRGRYSPDDPFYWRFLEFGAAKMPGARMLQRAAAKLGSALAVFRARIGPQINKLNGGKGVEL